MTLLNSGRYATSIYLPLSTLARKWRNWHRRLRGKHFRHRQITTLPSCSWWTLTQVRHIQLVKKSKMNGNVTIPELAIICGIARDCGGKGVLFEIGTFDGRTTLHLAVNTGPDVQVVTLDLPRGEETAFSLATGEEHMVDKGESGSVYREYARQAPEITDKIKQCYGDSATFDFSAWHGACSFVFIDASHQYENVLSDSRNAMAMIRSGGVILWHDYGVWEGVTRALEELAKSELLHLQHIAGTSLVYWKKP